MANILPQSFRDAPLLLIEAPMLAADNGRRLFHHFVKEAATQGTHIHLLQCDISHKFGTEALTSLPIATHHIQPLFDQKSDAAYSGVTTLLNIVDESASKGTKVLIAIDSLSSMLIYEDLGTVCRALGQCMNRDEVTCLAFVHSEAHSSSVLEKLRYISPSVAALTASKRNEFSCCVTWRKKSGKTLSQVEKYVIDEKLELKFIPETKAPKTENRAVPAAQTVPQSTFRLGLSSKEESERSQVILPYQRVEQTSQIVYEPDEDDMEDPDDDLEV